MPQQVTSQLFFELVDEVLVEAGRQRLEVGGAPRAVIEVRPNDKVLQILAGPGSGKTEMLVWRVLYELFVLGTPSHEVMVTTFTRRAATELQIRLVERAEAFARHQMRRGLEVIDPRVHDLRIGTIHSLCDQLLAEFDAEHVESGTQLIDEHEIVIRAAREHRFVFGLNATDLGGRLISNRPLAALFRSPWEDSPQWPGTLMERTSFLLGLVAQVTETWIPRCGQAGTPHGLQAQHGPGTLTDDLVAAQAAWEAHLQLHKILDFATIQKRFMDRQHLLVGKFAHVLVDEFQDSNPIQFALHTRWLSSEATRLTVVGDDDQAIYRFRGSDITCFQGLEPHCASSRIPFRRETLGVNHRSTRRIVEFTQAFKRRTPLAALSMSKVIECSATAADGGPVRLLQGPWSRMCQVVAGELSQTGVGRVPVPGSPKPPSAAVLLFSTSEKSSQRNGWDSPALEMRTALEAQGLRVCNPRNKMAGTASSPVGQLLALISYLIDPVSKAPVGANNRRVEVWASMSDRTKGAAAISAIPSFPINNYHATLQKSFLKEHGGQVGLPAPDRRPVVAFVDRVRQNLAAIPAGESGRLTLAGFVARLLAHEFFRNCGFTVRLFREAFFTQLLEANIAPTRLSTRSLDQPLQATLVSGKYQWPDQYWSLLNYFGAFLEDNKLDDPEVEAFEDDAVMLLTFHQAKGLEFDYVYVGGMGREPDFGPALRTRLFSGEPVACSMNGDGITTTDAVVHQLAHADRDREVYVALTRAKKQLTLLQDTSNPLFYMAPNSVLVDLFPPGRGRAHNAINDVEVSEWLNA